MTTSKTATSTDSLGDIAAGQVNKTYRVGTLEYTKKGMVVLFLWLLWGDFCFSLMVTVVPSVLPLKLNQLGASNMLLGLLITTIPSIMSFSVVPIVSFRSDRYRSRLGRRIPFLLFATPFVALSLILIGLSEEIGGLIASWFHVSPGAVILGFIGLMVVFFQIFNMFISSVYYYLFNDVVPEAFLSRFMSLFRVVGLAAGTFFSMFIFRYAETNAKEIFLVIGLLYFVVFMLMCWKVKEGEYPPPHENVEGKKGALAACRTYAQECFTHRFYWYFFLANTFMCMTGCVGAFNVFFYKSLGISLEQLGYTWGCIGLVSMAIAYPAGILADRYHPLRVVIIASMGLIPTTAVSMIFLFYDFQPHTTLMIVIFITLITLPFGAIYGVAVLPMYMKLLPKDRFGQFSSADAIIRSFAIIVGSVAAGAFMDVMKNIHHGNPFYYRYVVVWQVFFLIISLFFMLLVYRHFKKLGGISSYSAPN